MDRNADSIRRALVYRSLNPTFQLTCFIFIYTYLSQGAKNSSSSSYGGKATSKSPAKGAKNPSAPITKPSAASSAKKSYDDDDYGYGE